MILLGSIERAQLQSLLSQQLGRARRLEYIRERSLSEKKNLSVLTVPSKNDENQRVSQEVRFQVRGHCTRRHSVSSVLVEAKETFCTGSSPKITTFNLEKIQNEAA